MSSTPSPPPNEPASSSQSTLQSAPPTNNVRIKTPEAPASLDDLLKSPNNPALHHHHPSSNLKGASPHDPRRRSGFHLWRTESEDARQARLRQAIEAAEAQANAPGTFNDRLRNKFYRAADWISSHRLFSLYRSNPIELPQDPDDPLIRSDDASRYHGFAAIPEPKLTRLGLIILTLSLAGAQLAWTLELAYGTPYLLSLGLSEQSTSLVWLAGPLSGLIAQPVVGSLSDHSSSSFRRRKYMMISASLLILSTITLAYSVPISTALVDLFGGGLADWDPHRHELVHSTTQAISVIAFWILDFALNGLQAASRALILDTAPSEQQSIANAWQGRMTHAGNVVGYLCGWVDLASWRGLRWLGGGQFRRFAMISLLAMVSCVSVTVTFISESPADDRFAFHQHQPESMCTSAGRKIKETLDDVWHAIRRLPRSVRRVCLVQLFAFMGWFPFLFYSTTYILQIGQYERNLKRQLRHGLYDSEPGHGGAGGGSEGRKSSDRDAERGSFAMLLFAIVSLASGTLLPYLALAGEKKEKGKTQLDGHQNKSIPGTAQQQQQQRHDQDQDDSPTPPLRLDIPSSASNRHDLDSESLQLQHQNHEMGQDERLSRVKRISRGITQGLTLRTFWTLASIAFALLMLVGTAWASTVYEATIVIALVGVPWSIAAWAPFAMVGEFVREAEDGASPFEFDEDHWSPARIRARSREAARKGSVSGRSRRESVRSIIKGAGVPRGGAGGGEMLGESGFSPTSANGEVGKGRRRGSFKYIDSNTNCSPRRPSSSVIAGGVVGGGEQGIRERIRASLVDCAPLPHALPSSSHRNGEPHSECNPHGGDPMYEESLEDYSSGNGSGGAGTILGIHNLAIVAPQFLVAIISSLIFSTVHHSQNNIHLVLGPTVSLASPHPHQPSSFLFTNTTNNNAYSTFLVEDHSGAGGGGGGGGGGVGGGVSNPAEGTIWVLRFGGLMAILAALMTRFVPLTLSERRARYNPSSSSSDEDQEDGTSSTSGGIT